MYIETQRLFIRDFVMDDVKDLHDILGDAEVMKNCEPAYSFEKTSDFLSKFCIGRKGAVAAVHKDSGKMIGYILFNVFDDSVYEIGWFFNKNYWRQGYAYESCKAVIDYAFNELDAHKIFAESIDSVKSVGLMKKLGMQLEGIQRSHTKDNDGNWADFYYYGLFKEDWPREENKAMDKLELYVPKLDELWFRQKMMADPETMSYNANWDVDYDGYHRDSGCIDFPEEKWAGWYHDWTNNEPERFYAYIKRDSDGAWIGEISFYHTPEEDWWDMGIVIHAPFRGKGYAVPALRLMLDHAFRDCGINRLHNDFEVTRPAALKIHLAVGFKKTGIENGIRHVMLTKEEYLLDNKSVN